MTSGGNGPVYSTLLHWFMKVLIFFVPGWFTIQWFEFFDQGKLSQIAVRCTSSVVRLQRQPTHQILPTKITSCHHSFFNLLIFHFHIFKTK